MKDVKRFVSKMPATSSAIETNVHGGADNGIVEIAGSNGVMSAKKGDALGCGSVAAVNDPIKRESVVVELDGEAIRCPILQLVPDESLRGHAKSMTSNRNMNVGLSCIDDQGRICLPVEPDLIKQYDSFPIGKMTSIDLFVDEVSLTERTGVLSAIYLGPGNDAKASFAVINMSSLRSLSPLNGHENCGE